MKLSHLALENDHCPPYGYYHVVYHWSDGSHGAIAAHLDSRLPNVFAIAEAVAQQIGLELVDNTSNPGRLLKGVVVKGI